MNELQLKAAREDMVEWLSHPDELGREPDVIECVGTFKINNMSYYMFRYKINKLLGRWLLGVSGGYEGAALIPCGHTLSQMEEYHSQTAEKDARQMVKIAKEYWEEEGGMYEEDEDYDPMVGSFIGVPLLKGKTFDFEQLVFDLKEEWNLDINEMKGESKGEGKIFQIGDAKVFLQLMPFPFQEEEFLDDYEGDCLWPEVVEAAKKNKAYLIVAVLGEDSEAITTGKLFVKIMTSCCKQDSVLALYTIGEVFKPEAYSDFAKSMEEGEFPILNLVRFGLYKSKKGFGAYTFGMEAFGRMEMEIIDAEDEPDNIISFLVDIATTLLEDNIYLEDSETVGFSAEDKHRIQLSPGVELPQNTLKIQY